MRNLQNSNVIGIDLGGTKVLSGLVKNGELLDKCKVGVPQGGSEEEVLQSLYDTIDPFMSKSIEAIGVGVPSVVDIDKGIVYDVQNISSWQEVHLKSILENKYGIPVYLNNDANCFAIGEKHFGNGQRYQNFVAMIIGTGLAAGIVIDDRLYNGRNCGAGEFGMISYLDHYYEYYCSGQFFNNIHHTDGASVYKQAMGGDKKALEIFDEFGGHVGNAINTILYAVDPEIIIMGGSVSRTYPLFKDAMWRQIEKNVYRSFIKNLKIELSTDQDIPVLGAAALCYETFDISS